MIDDDFDWWIRKINEMFDSTNYGGYLKDNDDTVYNYKDKGIDIQIDDDYIYITVETKSNENDLKVTPKDEHLTVEYVVNGSWLRRNIPLPKKVVPDTAKITFVNNTGILDVSLEIDKNE